ncbi:hypothetical protein BASA81_005694 [Batrachochytrium salamandrivorans]|nr:hypothetical protein BASA81_005694 [Batrachochytrium salamandrivorans]
MGGSQGSPNRDSVTVASFLYELMMNYGSPLNSLRTEEVHLSLKESGSDDGPIKETMAPLDDVELMEERAELTAREFDELGQHGQLHITGRRFDATINESDLAPWIQSNHSNLKFSDGTHRTEFTDNEQEDSDIEQEDFIEQENYDMENEDLLIKKIITNKSKVFKENY